jgi:hypothetical protein
MVKIYIDTPWYVPQPHGVAIDLSLPNAEIMAQSKSTAARPRLHAARRMAGRGRAPGPDYRVSTNRRIPVTEFKRHHARVYYNPAIRPTAERLRDAIVSRFAVRPGAFSDEPIGPHPISQFSVIFRTEEFQNVGLG